MHRNDRATHNKTPSVVKELLERMTPDELTMMLRVYDGDIDDDTEQLSAATDDADRMIRYEVSEWFVFKDQTLPSAPDPTSLMSDIAERIAEIYPAGSREWRRACDDVHNSIFEEKGRRRRGRPKDSKSNTPVRYSKAELYEKLDCFISSYFESEGREPTQAQAAKALGLGYEEKLKKMRRGYDDKRHWKTLMREVLSTRK